eukprot:Pompholyxophrys_punicea_v1_NODE_18_length_5920_cov_44.741176.p4 type:complete len:136 gc:universal NODE_18_length_5920_cov_44.741176:3699-4106(+)
MLSPRLVGLYSEKDVNTALGIFLKYLNEVTRKFTTEKEPHPRPSKPWMSESLLRKISHTYYLRMRANVSKNPVDILLWKQAGSSTQKLTRYKKRQYVFDSTKPKIIPRVCGKYSMNSEESPELRALFPRCLTWMV